MSAPQNHAEIGTGGSRANAGQRKYEAVPFSAEHFHKSCSIQDYNNRWEVRNCELVGLPDLDQANPYVRDKIADQLSRLVDMGVAGFRIDAAKHIEVDQLLGITKKVHNLNENHNFPKNARPFITQEVSDYGGQAITREEYFPVGTVTEFKFGKFLHKIFMNQDQLKWLKNWGQEWGLMSPKYGLVFLENHDTQRSNDALTYKQAKKYKVTKNAFYDFFHR